VSGESREPAHHAGMAALSLGALGIVFGDIGTSPLYALQTVFAADHHAVRATQTGVYGVISLVFWAVTIIVSIKYVAVIMRADNDGEGGIMALIALLRGSGLTRATAPAALVALGIFGASLFYGDGMITPAISVLSAVEGIEVAAPSLQAYVVPIALVILTVLFAAQRFGTGAFGRLFGPVMGTWFTILAIAGFAEVVQHPGILRAIAPTYAITFLFEHGATAFIALGSVVLTVTGAEALYADMGHFGRSPIRIAWFAAVFPALILNYMGQGALILHTPTAVDNPFFLLFPHWSRIPMVVLATLATVIASQAVISGAFSVTRQAVQLGFLPRLNILHTSREAGQVYVPAVNWGIFAAVVGLVVGFGSSSHLASAYGIAVTGTLAIDTLLFFVVVRVLWKKPLWVAVAGAGGFLLVDLTFFAANLPKVAHGGWFPLVIAFLIFVVLTTWQRGREIVTEKRTELEGPLRDFVEEIRHPDQPLSRSPRTGIFLDANPDTTPLALRANVEHNCVLHENVVIVAVETLNVPHVDEAERVTIDDLGYRDDGITHVTARFGFQDDLDVPQTLRNAAERLEREADFGAVSYFLSRISIVATDEPGMARWRKKLFITIARNAANPVPYFNLPEDRTIVMASHVEL
jgi:KUP system potassium uptake protein